MREGPGDRRADPSEPAAPPAPVWARRLLALCLRTWPRKRRRTHGDALLEASEALLAAAAGAGAFHLLREVVGEAAGLVGGGLALRGEGLRREAAATLDGGGRDLRLALRSLRRSPGFTTVTVVLLGLGIGANAAVFGLVDRVLLADPPYRDPDALVLVWNTLPGSPERIPMSGPDAAVLGERSRTLAEVAFLARAADAVLETPGAAAAEHVRVSAVTTNLLDVLGVQPTLGRAFTPGDGAPGAAAAPDAAPAGPASPTGSAGPAPVDAAAGEPVLTTALLSHGAWRTLFAADPGAVGRTVRLNGLPVVVAGVLPPGFRVLLPPDAGVGTDVDVWLPLRVPLAELHRDEGLLDRDSDNTGAVVARRASGASLAAVGGELSRIAADLEAEVPARATAGLGLSARPLHADATAHARDLLLALLAGAAAVLVISCLDVAGLLAARGVGRSGEMAVRAALGAGRSRILRQILTEGAVLLALGIAAAWAFARLAAGLLARTVPPELAVPAAGPAGMAPLVLAAGVAGVAVVLAGLLPAARLVGLEGRGGVAAGLETRGEGARGPRRALVAGQVALAVVLVLGAGLLLRTVDALDGVRPGFERDGALTFDLSLRVAERHRGPSDRAAVLKAMETRLRELGGVTGVGWVGGLPLSGERWTQPFGLPGQAPAEWEANRADFRVASSGYFDALGVRLLEGRTFTAREDLFEDARVVVVDELLAHRMVPEGSAVGAVIGLPVDGAPVEARVIGVVEHVRHETLDADGRAAVWVPYRQEASREVSFVVRTAGDPLALASAVRAAVREVDPGVPVHELRTLADRVDAAVAPRRFALALLAAFASLALTCAAIGLYGVVAFDVGRRTRDVGLRMAVGASPGRVVGHVLGTGLRLAAPGLALGVLLAAGAARSLRSVVFGVGVADPATWAAVVAVVVAVTLVACALPALRASRLDPVRALGER